MESQERKDRVTKQELIERIRHQYPDYHPIMAMLEIAFGTKSEQMRFACHKEIAQYIEPKLQSIAVGGSVQVGTGVMLIKDAPDRDAWIEAAGKATESTLKLVQAAVIDQKEAG